MKQTIDLGNGDKYEGDLSNKLKHGYGIYTWSYGDSYTGDWLNDKQHGHGVYQFANGGRYEGEFREGEFNGEGTLRNQAKEDDDIVEYVGHWVSSLPHGRGTALYKNGDKYEGTFERGERNGNGAYWFNRHFRYEG